MNTEHPVILSGIPESACALLTHELMLISIWRVRGWLGGRHFSSLIFNFLRRRATSRLRGASEGERLGER
eukprot:scaffold208669_cov30-Tisochrysis_lutea.AAC.1